MFHKDAPIRSASDGNCIDNDLTPYATSTTASDQQPSRAEYMDMLVVPDDISSILFS